MKKLLIILLCLPLLFNSCKKDDDGVNENINNTSPSIVGYWNSTEWNIVENQGYWTTYPNGQKVITHTQSQTNNFWLDLTFQSNGDAAGIDEDGSVMPTEYYKNGDTLLMDVYTFIISTLTSSNLTLELFENDTNTSLNPINDTIYFTEKSELFKFERD
tara:strand:+ start:2549 stop:3025 length:477 start_codon:yes stop_codon:yes gene_type:complete